VRIPMEAIYVSIVSFTYGDLFPAMRVLDGRPYRGQVYTLTELPQLIQTYGLPQVWNADGQRGPERYIEAQLWSDEPLVTIFESYGASIKRFERTDGGIE